MKQSYFRGLINLLSFQILMQWHSCVFLLFHLGAVQDVRNQYVRRGGLVYESILISI